MYTAGTTIGRYTIEAYLGEGGMGRVYRAHDPVLDRRVALKIVRAERGDDALRDGTPRLLREARAAAKLHHVNAVSVFDVGEIDGTPFLAMELIEGRTLRAYIGDEKVSLSLRLSWLADVALALAAAHRAGIVHRDVKPDNVMVRDDGVVKVLDFGLARRARGSATGEEDFGSGGAQLTVEGLRVGTPLYMTPEQIRGDELDGRSDQFAWGVLAYELLSGNVPWKARRDPLSLVAAILTQAAPRLDEEVPALPPSIGAVIARCLAKPAEERFASMEDLLVALTVAGGPPASMRRAERPGADSARSQRAPSSRRGRSERPNLPFQSTAEAFAATIVHGEAETRTSRSDESFRLLIEASPEGILISRERVVCYVNRALVAFLGYDTQEELVGRSALDVVHPEDRAIVTGRLQSIDTTGVAAVPRRMRFLRRDGSTVTAESIGVPMVFNGQQAIAAMIRPLRADTKRRKRRRRRKSQGG